MDGKAEHSDPDIERLERLLVRHLQFYEDLRTRRRRPKTSAQREFIDVVRGVSDPQTDHEKAYLHYLAREGRPVTKRGSGLPANFRHSAADIGKKWSDAAENMSQWKPWHD